MTINLVVIQHEAVRHSFFESPRNATVESELRGEFI